MRKPEDAHEDTQKVVGGDEEEMCIWREGAEEQQEAKSRE